MKVIVKKEKLIKSLQKIQGVIEKRTTMPILNNMLIETDNSLIIKATNLDLSVIVKEEAQIEREGKICIPAKKLFEIVKLLPTEDVILEQVDKNIIINSGKTNFKLFTYPAEDFPIIKTLEKNKGITINKNKFFESIKKVEYTIYPDESRESLHGIFIHKVEDKLRFVASDGFRLAYNEFSFGESCEDVLIPKKAVTELTKLQNDGEKEELILYISNNMLMIELENTILISKLKESKFPNYTEVIPNNPYKLFLNKNEILETLRRVSVISDEATKSVILNIDENKIILKSNNADLGYAEDEIAAQYDGVPFETCFNAKFMIEVIEPLNSDTIKMELKDSQSAAVISGDECYKAVLMPIRLQ
ncbi:MAG: DNA polymerase III subunit beta [bacterium]